MHILIVSLKPTKSVLAVNHDYSSKCIIKLVVFEFSFFNETILFIKEHTLSTSSLCIFNNKFDFSSQSIDLSCGLQWYPVNIDGRLDLSFLQNEFSISFTWLFVSQWHNILITFLFLSSDDHQAFVE